MTAPLHALAPFALLLPWPAAVAVLTLAVLAALVVREMRRADNPRVTVRLHHQEPR